MSDPYTNDRPARSDPGPTPTDLLACFDAMSGSATRAWRGDWNRYAAWLFSFCLRRSVPEADAQDAVQEVLAALASFRRFRRVHPGAPLRPWMIGVLRRKLADLRRDRSRRPDPIPAEHLDVLSGTRRVDVDLAPGEEAAASPYAPILDRVRRRCAEPRNWDAFRGVVLEGKSAAEVAAELGMSLADVYTAKARGLCRLREEIGAEAAPMVGEFDERTWTLFRESAVAGSSPEVVASRLGGPEVEVHAAVARVLRRFRERLRPRD